MTRRRKAKPRRKKKGPPIRLPVPPPGGPHETKRGRKGYERSGEHEDLQKQLDEAGEEEEPE